MKVSSIIKLRGVNKMGDIRNEIKALVASSGWTMVDIVKVLNEKYGTDTTSQNLSNKLSRETIKYKEVKLIAEIIGYKLEWTKK